MLLLLFFTTTFGSEDELEDVGGVGSDESECNEVSRLELDVVMLTLEVEGISWLKSWLWILPREVPF